MMMQVVDDAQIAYEAYRNHTGGISLATGGPIPGWAGLRPDIQAAWKASADALRSALFCPVHDSLNRMGDLRPFDMCIGCMRVERDELRAELDRRDAAIAAGKQ